MRPFKGNVFYREKTILRQLFFRSVGARLLDASAARLASRRKTFRFSEACARAIPGKVRSGFPSGIAQKQRFSAVRHSEKR
ncbi:hypothetical protein FJ419_05365 [Mesorhizobium sp. B2-6-2]|nr:hypothetical protein FJ419_05365 [Mesorhizobium sp. B2-6-2]